MSRRRRVTIPPHVIPAIEAHLSDHVGLSPERLLFTGEKGGPLRVHVLEAAWRNARASVGRPELPLHDLRHSGNTWAAATGASTAELMARMGHASPVAALRYQHATEERDRTIAEELSPLAAPAPVVPIPDHPRDGHAIEHQNGPSTPTAKRSKNPLPPAVSLE
ncbi:MAG: tyrosine-type recombinase/integrase, partial [Acidimicrobiales bacterium]